MGRHAMVIGISLQATPNDEISPGNVAVEAASSRFSRTSDQQPLPQKQPITLMG